MPCPKQRRRSLLLTALATGACPAAVSSTAAEEDQPGSDERPQSDVIRRSDLTLSGPPVHAWPKDPKTSVIRKGSRLNEILVIKLDPGELDEETRSRSADGMVAYSVICTHTGCPVSKWVTAEGRDKNVLKRPRHNSELNPRQSAQVVFGPVPLRLAALPMQIATVP
jgi:rieske iron-sulfur protein